MFKELFTFGLKVCLLVATVWGSVLLIAAKGWTPDPPPKWVAFVGDARNAIHEAQAVANSANSISANLKGVADALVKPLSIVQDIVSKAPPMGPPKVDLPSKIQLPPSPCCGSGGGTSQQQPTPDLGLNVARKVFNF